MTKQEKEEQRKIGWIQGVAYVAGQVQSLHNEDRMAFEILSETGLSASEFKHAIAYDLTLCRQGSESREFLKGVRGKQ